MGQVKRGVPPLNGEADTANLKRRNLTWFARMVIPAARWAHVGRAHGTTCGLKRDVERTLEKRRRWTRRRRATDPQEMALQKMEAEVDATLGAIGLLPLSGAWASSWQNVAIRPARGSRRLLQTSHGPHGEELSPEREKKQFQAFDAV